MTSDDLKTMQKMIKFDAPSMAAGLGISHDQYRRYYYGHALIPPYIERAAIELVNVNLMFIQERYKPGGDFDKLLDVLHPNGIISEVTG